MAINPLAVGGGVVAAAAVVGGGLYAGGVFSGGEKTNTRSDDKPKPPLISLKEEADYKTTSNKFGYKFSSYFLSTTSPNNKEEWGKRFAAFEKDKNSLVQNSFFASIKDAATVEKLQTSCKAKYDEAGAITGDDTWKEVWTYCSLGGTAPVTLEHSSDAEEKKSFAENGAHASKVGGTKKSELLSTKSTENDWIWEIKNKEKNITETHTFFNTRKTQNLKAICEAAYQQDQSAEGNTNLPTQVETYCSKPRITVNA